MPYCKTDGLWHNITGIYGKVDNTWREIKEGYCKIDGTWREFYSGTKVFGVRISKSTSDPTSRVEYIEGNAGWAKGTKDDPSNWLTGDTPFTGIKPVMFNGTEWTDLNKRDLSKDVSGNSVQLTTTGNDVFVEIPTWWLSITTDGIYDYIRFANRPLDSTYKKLASLWNGSDRGMFHVGAFHATYSASKLYSKYNQSPEKGHSLDEYIRYAQSRGSGYDILTWHISNYIKALTVLYFGTTDLQSVLYGYADYNAVAREDIITFDNDLGIVGSSTKGDMSFLWINHLWGNISTCIGGARTNSNYELETIDNGEPISTTSGTYVTHSTGPISVINTSGYIKNMDMQNTNVGFFPISFTQSELQYWSDYGYVGALYDYNYCTGGGNWNDEQKAGPFNIGFDGDSSATMALVSARLVYRAGRQ